LRESAPKGDLLGAGRRRENVGGLDLAAWDKADDAVRAATLDLLRKATVKQNQPKG
jgi:hypothetical protein